MHPQSGPPSQPSMSASSTPPGPSPYAFDAARRRSLNGKLPLPLTRLTPPRWQTKLGLMLNSMQLLLTSLRHPHPSHDLRWRRRLRLRSSRCIQRNRNVLHTRQVLVLESSLDSARRIAQVAACPSRPSSVEVMQVLPPSLRNHKHRLPPMRHCPTIRACSHPRLDVRFRLVHDQTLLLSVDSHRQTDWCMAVTPQERRKDMVFLLARHPRDPIATMALRVAADSHCHLRIKPTSPQASRHNAFSGLRQTTL